MEDKKVNISSVDKKMSVIISLLLKIANNGNEISLKDQIRNLSAFGLTSAEIADIIGKKVGHVSKELSELKKTNK